MAEKLIVIPIYILCHIISETTNYQTNLGFLLCSGSLGLAEWRHLSNYNQQGQKFWSITNPDLNEAAGENMA